MQALQEDRHEDRERTVGDRDQQRERHRHARHRARREGIAREERRRRPPVEQDHRDQQHDGREEEAELGERQGHDTSRRHDGDRQTDQRDPAEGHDAHRAALLCPRPRQGSRRDNRQQRREDGHGVEGAAPVSPGREGPADHGADQDRHAPRTGKQRGDARPHRLGKGVAHQHIGHGREHAAPKALHEATGHHHAHRRRYRADERPDAEDHRAGAEGRAGAQPCGQVSRAGRRDDRRGEEGRGRPAHHGRAADILDDAGQHRRQHQHVHRVQEDATHQRHQERHPLRLQERRPTDRYRHRRD